MNRIKTFRRCPLHHCLSAKAVVYLAKDPFTLQRKAFPSINTPPAIWQFLITTISKRRSPHHAIIFTILLILVSYTDVAIGADESLSRESSWEVFGVPELTLRLRQDLDAMGVAPEKMDDVVDQYQIQVETEDADPLDAYIDAVGSVSSVLSELIALSNSGLANAAESLDPSAAGYASLLTLPETTRLSARVWLGRDLVRHRLYDEALPIFVDVIPEKSVDPASTLFYRGACHHALLNKKEALADLRRLLENQDECPIRFSRTAALMIADIKPLKEDSLDEISRMMTDVTRRLDLGRSGEQVEQREQKIIDKLTKLIEKLEEQQQQQQQSQNAGGAGGAGGQPGAGAADSQAAGGALGNGDVDRKKRNEGPAWGNLPPAERQQTIQQISRDLPTHYREAIEAYFRKLATDGNN